MAVTQAVDRLREVFQADRETPPKLTKRLRHMSCQPAAISTIGSEAAHAPRGFAKAGGELGAAAGVYRNAAVAFKSLADVDGDQREARSNACATLLGTG